jgi:hypothetical protein
LGKIRGVVRVIERVKKGSIKTLKNTFGTGCDKFEQRKDSKRFEN